MSVSVNHITKIYGKQKVLNNISFDIGAGELVGFLGPNGAGKSTMMKILTGYITQSEGEVSVCGINVLNNSIESRKKIGYLPEHNPLYLDMYIREFLFFIADIHKIKNKKERVHEMIELTGLSPEKSKKIRQLSKGYRQRVGLAAALIHDPEVLILDEPTTGLDPNQLKEIRALIKSIAEKKTIMLSTHIMQEVEAICDRVIIIKNGEIVADNKIEMLQSKGEEIIEVEFQNPIPVSILKGLKEVKSVVQKSSTRFELISDESKDIRPMISQFAINNSNLVLSMQKREQKMEDIFQQLTKD
ncbi:MAG: gliding motility-associated ABC transporter ATP-binding subunit GldA [Flavobacteriales bacterium]|nr:gliding motility-associated ABC transporter ATP-binding subunit GldA [Flavobacteriales bacterium]|tara:strand:+ start:23481 stop:24383 length:903 start_codon:yes stop_codon:yes gene_type:complete